jgi:hypothetical protein
MIIDSASENEEEQDHQKQKKETHQTKTKTKTKRKKKPKEKKLEEKYDDREYSSDDYVNERSNYLWKLDNLCDQIETDFKQINGKNRQQQSTLINLLTILTVNELMLDNEKIKNKEYYGEIDQFLKNTQYKKKKVK